jgi:hypothetical protein
MLYWSTIILWILAFKKVTKNWDNLKNNIKYVLLNIN